MALIRMDRAAAEIPLFSRIFPDKGNPRLNAFAQTGISIASELTQSIRNYFSKAAFRSIGIAW